MNDEYDLDFFIFENVSGLTHKQHTRHFEAILNMLENANFYISYKILDAQYYGVPQKRKRVFIVGWNKRKFPNMKYPFPAGSDHLITTREAIGGLT